ncbi:stage II sporulation protein P [Anaerovirgula multivorans]|uniref:Stage II sporulation protein P n=1 Tax=Anaerovirgula multivorans TaxID=312168 RepID=A0A239KBY3_9FIRM|nr:stage II sporulation protein P [Anaerovirgula multivorans]SNT15173.1 stage II sporulation protein P [Anaerovirgula multivorans]
MKRKLAYVKNYHNIIILILILAILFFFGKIILNKNSFAEASSVGTDMTTLEPKKDLTSENKFLVHAIHQAFPATAIQEKATIGSYIHTLYSSFIYNIFTVDFKNPITFVQAQFPAIRSYPVEQQSPTKDITPKTPDNDSRDIFFVDLDNNKESVAAGTLPKEEELKDLNPQEKDDLGESWQGIYLVGEDDIVDSLDSGNSETIVNVKKPKKIKFEEGKPHILIYHTHGTESYKPASEGNYHTLRKEYSVIAVGEILKQKLEKEGYNVIHDTTYHDHPSYSGSYTRSLETARKILEANPSIKIVLDVHRDGYDNIETNPNRNSLIANNRVTINNEVSTRFQFVIGPESANRQEVETFATYIKAVSDSKYPGFSKPILLKPYGRYNQFLVDHYALLEVGSNANTIEEVKKAAAYLADVLIESLKHIKE